MSEAVTLALQYPALKLVPLITFGLMLVEWLYVRLALEELFDFCSNKRNAR